MKSTKRFLAAVTALVMAPGTAVYASADNTKPLDISVTSDSANVSYSVDPSYTVVIPANVTLSDTAETSAEISLDETAKPFKLAKNQKLAIKIADIDSNDFKVTNKDLSLDYTVTAGSAVLEKGSVAAEFSSDDKTAKTLTFSQMDADEAIYSGDYTGTLTFEIEITGAVVDLSALTGDYEVKDGEVLTGTLAGNYRITVADGAGITLKNAVINGANDEWGKWAGITALGDATITLEGENTVKGFGLDSDYPGIYVPRYKTLTIKGNGKLTVSSNGNAAAIGSGYGTSSGNIVIEGGNITATGGKSSAGIGSAPYSDCGNITITGGNITATGGESGAGIGCGAYARCGDITITGEEITATGGESAAGIGCGGPHSYCGNITITNTVKKVTAKKGVEALNSIGLSYNSSCSNVTIGGEVGLITASPYTYEPNS